MAKHARTAGRRWRKFEEPSSSSEKRRAQGEGTRPSAPDVDWSIQERRNLEASLDRTLIGGESLDRAGSGAQPSQKRQKWRRSCFNTTKRRTRQKAFSKSWPVGNHVWRPKEPPEEPQKGGPSGKLKPPKRTPRKIPWEPLRGGETGPIAEKHFILKAVRQRHVLQKMAFEMALKCNKPRQIK